MTAKKTRNGGTSKGPAPAEKGPWLGTRTKQVIRDRWDTALKEMGTQVGNATGDQLRASNLVEMWAVWFSTRPLGERVRWARAYRAAFSRQLDRIEMGEALDVEAGAVATPPGDPKPGTTSSLGGPGDGDDEGPEVKPPGRGKGK